MKIIHISYGGPDRRIRGATGKVWRFEMHPYCGPGVTRGPLSALAWISRSREWAWVDALHQPSRDVLVLH